MQVLSKYKDGRLILYMKGELDQHAAKKAMQSIEATIDEYLPRECLIDMSELDFMDSSGIAVLLKTYKRVRNIGGKIGLSNISKQPMKVIDASGLNRLMKIS